MKRFASFIILATLISCIPQKKDDYKLNKGMYPIVATHPFWLNQCNVKTYKGVLEAGFNSSYNDFNDIKGVEQFLRVADSLNTKVMVTSPELCRGDTIAFKTISEYRSLAGVLVRDEPSIESFNELSKIIDDYRRINGDIILQVNLYPIYAKEKQLGTFSYEYYVKSFLEIVQPKMFSFDNYPITNNGLMPDYFKNYEIVSSYSKKYQIPYWGYVLCSAFDNYPVPTRGTIAFQAHTNLAYGAQGISYFTYRRTINPASFASPVDSKFKKTKIHDIVRSFNTELAFYSNYVLNSLLLNVFHVGAILPEGTKFVDYTKIPEISNMKGGRKGFIVSCFRKDGNRYLILVNKDYKSKQSITILPSKIIKRISYESTNNYSFRQKKTITVSPGGMVLLQL